MASPTYPEEAVQAVMTAYYECGCNKTEAAKKLGIHRMTVRRMLDRAVALGLMPVDDLWSSWDTMKGAAPHLVGKPPPPAPEPEPVPDSEESEPVPEIHGQIHHDEGQPVHARAAVDGVKRYILTVCQNNTKLHEGLWRNLLAYAEYLDAQILVARCTYDIENYRDRKAKQLSGVDERPQDAGLWYPPELEPYTIAEGSRTLLAPDLVFVADNLRPTLLDPLAAMDTYTGDASMILPHTQLAMRSVATMKYANAKFLYTTGAITLRNYLPKREGKKASFHHAYGALLVEVDEASNDWWVRQLHAGDDGTFYDWNVKVAYGQITTEHRPLSVTWGDIHVAKLPEHVIQAVWAPGGLVDELRPTTQVFHDILDFYARNHHELKDPMAMFRRWVEGRDSVEEELKQCAAFVAQAHRPWALSVVVNSNHDRAFEKWLKEADWRKDPLNARVFMRAVASMLDAIVEGNDDYHLLEWALKQYDCPDGVMFLHEDESYVLGGVEHGLHGDRGANGAKGSPTNLKRLPSKANIGDKHSAGIYQGLYVAGVMADLDMAYNKGPSSWSRSFILTHETGKRQIITMRGARAKA